MKYFQYLDLDWKPVADKLKHFVLNNKELVGYETTGWKRVPISNLISLMPDIVIMLRPLGVIPIRVSFHICHSNSIGIHRDATEHDCRRILIPVMNCENSVTRFYKSDKEKSELIYNDGVPSFYNRIDESECEFMEEYYLNRAVAIRPKELHAVYTTNPILPRISCPIEVNKDLSHLFI